MDDDRFNGLDDVLADLQKLFGLSRGAAENKLRQICASGDVRMYDPAARAHGDTFRAFEAPGAYVHGCDIGSELPIGLLVNEADFDWWLDRNAQMMVGSAPKPVRSPSSQSKGGRKRLLAKQVITAEISRLMDYHGPFSTDDPDWNAQARLEEKIKAFAAERIGEEPGENTVRSWVKQGLASYRAMRTET
jgi:hypothetical protein